MMKIKNYRYLLNNSRCLRLFVRPFKSEDIKEKLDSIFNSNDSRIDWSNIPVHLVTK